MLVSWKESKSFVLMVVQMKSQSDKLASCLNLRRLVCMKDYLKIALMGEMSSV